MRYLIFVTLIVVLGVAASLPTPPPVRFLPFQGQLLENGLPVNGQRTLQFSIHNNGVDWEETHLDVPVVQGLYALVLGTVVPLPYALFLGDGTHVLEVSVNGTPIDEVTIYAPILPAFLEDGIQMADVEGLNDALATSGQSSPQTLSIDGHTLSISEGNSIVLPTTSGTGMPSNELTVGSTDTTTQLDAGNVFGNHIEGSNEAWQSFKPSLTGSISSLKVQFTSLTGSGTIRLKLYSGEGTNSQPITQFDYSANGLSAPAPAFFELELPMPLPVHVGNTYTFSLTKLASTTSNPNNDLIFFQTDIGNNYPDGRASFSPDHDLKFQVHLRIYEHPNFVVESNGDVSAPNGWFSDKSGLVAFPGEVRMFAGPKENVPEGWLVCEGQLLNKNEYLELYNTIGYTWGDGNGNANFFRLPDFRGAFLRGVSGGSGKDPDAGSRYALNSGGNTGNKEGSYEDDDHKLHDHNLEKEFSLGGLSSTVELSYTVGEFDEMPGQIFPLVHYMSNSNLIKVGRKYSNSNGFISIQTTMVGGSETRPYNAYVYYIIKT